MGPGFLRIVFLGYIESCYARMQFLRAIAHKGLALPYVCRCTYTCMHKHVHCDVYTLAPTSVHKPVHVLRMWLRFRGTLYYHSI